MDKEQHEFANNDEWFGYLEAGKTFGNRDYYKAGTKLCADYQRGWDIGKKELVTNHLALRSNKV